MDHFSIGGVLRNSRPFGVAGRSAAETLELKPAGKPDMLTRRTLIASMGALAAGCGGFDFSIPGLRPPQQVPLTWVSRPYTGLINELASLSFEQKLLRIVQELAADTESPFGPTSGHYRLFLRYVERYAGPYSDPNAEQFRDFEVLMEWLGELEADLVTLGLTRFGH